MLTRSLVGMPHLSTFVNGGTISGVGVLVSGWAVWHRRVTWRVPHDRALTLAVIFCAMTLFFCSPAQYNYVDSYFFHVTGIDHVAGFLGHLSSLAAFSTCIYAAVSRLVPDEEIEPVMRQAEYPVVFASLMLLIALTNSGALRRQSHADMMEVPRDIWLTVYWVVYLLIVVYLAGFLIRLLLVLRTDPRSRTVATLLAAGAALGIVALAACGWDMVHPIPLWIIWATGGSSGIMWSLAAYWSVRLRFHRTEREEWGG